MILNSDRYSTTTTLRKNGVVVHDSEGAEGLLSVMGATSSSQLIAALASKGDRPSTSHPGSFFGAGYHAVACEDGSYVQVADASAAPYAAPPCNATWWHVCIPGRAAQTRGQWLDAASRAYIHAVARFIVDRWNADGRTWALELKSAPELVAADAKDAGHPAGYTSHAQVSQAWHQSDHTDPGPAFPWDVLAADIAALVTSSVPNLPTLGDDMARALQANDGDTAVIIVSGNIASWSGPEADFNVLKLLGLVEPTVHPVPRATFKALNFAGPLPEYTTPPAHATVGGDFKAVI